jgi:hypothetical protein
MADSVIEFVWPDSYNEAALQKSICWRNRWRNHWEMRK